MIHNLHLLIDPDAEPIPKLRRRLMTYTAEDINTALERVEEAKRNHPVGWGMLDEIGLGPSDQMVAYAFANADHHLTRLNEEPDRRVIYAVGWLQGLAVGKELGERRKVKYRKKPTLTEATQWFKNGDHPQDKSQPIELAGGSIGLSEGQLVRYFRSLNIPGARFCSLCGNVMQKHGLLEGLNGEETICPGDYIVTDRKGNHYRLPAVEFEAMYEPYEPAAHPTPKAEA